MIGATIRVIPEYCLLTDPVTDQDLGVKRVFTNILMMWILAPILVELWLRVAYWFFVGIYGERTLVNLARTNNANMKAFKVLEELTQATGGMMALKVDTNADSVVRYIPLDERNLPEGEKPTVLLLKRLDPFQSSRIRDKMMEVGRKGRLKTFRTMSIRTEMVIRQLVGWENVYNLDGDEVEFNIKEQVRMYGLLPEDLQRELEAVFGNGSYSHSAEETLIKSQEESDDDSLGEDVLDDIFEEDTVTDGGDLQAEISVEQEREREMDQVSP